MSLAHRATILSPSLTLAIDSKAKAMKAEGLDVCSFGAGEPDFDTPQHIKDACMAAIDSGFTKYTPSSGIPELRQAISEKFKADNGLDYKPSQIVVSNGAKHSCLNAILACVSEGDEVIIPAPYWLSYPEMVKMAGGEPVIVNTKEENGWKMTAEEFQDAMTPRTKMVILNSPGNPTGAVFPAETVAGLVELAQRHDLWLMADEVYDRLYYAGGELGEPVPSVLRRATRDDAVMVVHSFSKTYCMTGWRVGWLVARRDLAEKATQLNEFIISHAPSFAQKAAETALGQGESELRSMLERLKQNRDLCLDALRGLPGVTVPTPDGAFYLFPRVEGMTDSFAFCRELLEETRVGLAPGVAFGAGGEGSFRICYAAERSILEPAMERLTKFLRSHT